MLGRANKMNHRLRRYREGIQNDGDLTDTTILYVDVFEDVMDVFVMSLITYSRIPKVVHRRLQTVNFFRLE